MPVNCLYFPGYSSWVFVVRKAEQGTHSLNYPSGEPGELQALPDLFSRRARGRLGSGRKQTSPPSAVRQEPVGGRETPPGLQDGTDSPEQCCRDADVHGGTGAAGMAAASLPVAAGCHRLSLGAPAASPALQGARSRWVWRVGAECPSPADSRAAPLQHHISFICKSRRASDM